MPRRKGPAKHSKHNLPRFVRYNWKRIFSRLKKKLENREARALDIFIRIRLVPIPEVTYEAI